MNIIYVCTYIYICTYIYRYIHTIGGFGVPIQDFLGDFLVQKNLWQKNRDHWSFWVAALPRIRGARAHLARCSVARWQHLCPPRVRPLASPPVTGPSGSPRTLIHCRTTGHGLTPLGFAIYGSVRSCPSHQTPQTRIHGKSCESESGSITSHSLSPKGERSPGLGRCLT